MALEEGKCENLIGKSLGNSKKYWRKIEEMGWNLKGFEVGFWFWLKFG